MEIAFNELSSNQISETLEDAHKRMNQLVESYAASTKVGFKGIRFSNHLHEILLCSNYTIEDWIKTTSQKNYKDLLLGARRYPFIRDEDKWAEELYISNTFLFDDETKQRIRCYGLAAANIYSTLSISLSGFTKWENNYLNILVVNDSDASESSQTVLNIFSKECLLNPDILEFVERSKKIELILSTLPSKEKSVHLRDDHGKDVLEDFSDRLVHNPYVLKVINSLPWNPQSKKLIHKTFPDGKIEIVLHWTDRGLGMVIQTTGRTLAETKAIASILENKFDQ